jgi:hypothetical protein
MKTENVAVLVKRKVGHEDETGSDDQYYNYK